MKRVKIAVLLLCSTMLLSACGKTEAAKQADAALEVLCTKKLDEITLYDYEEIENADALVSALTEKEQKSLSHLSAYEIVHERYDAEYKKCVTSAVKAISSIGEVTLKSKNDIRVAQGYINSVPKDLQEKIIPNIDVFYAAKEVYSELCIKNVIALIDEIGEVTLEDEETIKTARAEYSKLDNEQKEKIENIEFLNDAFAKLTQLKEADSEKRLKTLKAKMKIKHDDFKECTFYTPSRMPKYNNSRSCILPYIGQRDSGEKWIVIRYNYAGDDWVFFTKAAVLVDGQKYIKDFDYFDITHGTGGGTVGEQYDDLNPTSADINMLEAIANSSETKVRFEGSDYHKDITISGEDKSAIQDVLDLYDLL